MVKNLKRDKIDHDCNYIATHDFCIHTKWSQFFCLLILSGTKRRKKKNQQEKKNPWNLVVESVHNKDTKTKEESYLMLSCQIIRWNLQNAG